MGRHPRLDRDEEDRLTREYARTADPAIAKRLALANLRLVVSFAKRYDRGRGNLADLIQEGNLGLLHAIRRFEADRGTHLGSYAVWWIRAYILKYLMGNARIVHLGRSRADRKAFLGGFLPPQDVALDDADDGVGSPDITHPPRPDEMVAEREAASLVRKRVDAVAGTLSPRETALLRERLLAEEPRSLRDLGRRFAVSGEAMRQTEGRLLGRLRDGIDVAVAA